MQPIFIQSPGFAGATVNIEQRFNGLRGFGFGADTGNGVNSDTIAHDATHNAGTPATGSSGGSEVAGNSPLRRIAQQAGVSPRVVGGVLLGIGALTLGIAYKGLYKNNHPVAGVVVGLLFGVGPTVGGAMMLATGEDIYAR
jgi:hypothetical protein